MTPPLEEASPPEPQREAPAPQRPARRRFHRGVIAFVLALVIGCASLIYCSTFCRYWDQLGDLPPSGGLWFPMREELKVPSFRQNDPAWGAEPLGPTDGTLGAEGCAVSSAAMVMKFYGIDTDPQRLNAYLTAHDGYTPQGWLYWEKAAELGGGQVQKAYEDLPSYRLIDENLIRGNPVIVRLKLPRATHFVVIAGKQGFDYLIRDPGAGAARGLYPLKELGSRIYALRFYKRTGQ